MAEHYAKNGFVCITGLNDSITSVFRTVLAGLMNADDAAMDAFLDPNGPPVILDEDVRKVLSRVQTPEPMAEALLGALEPLLMRLIGPLVHVSSTYHCQFKSAPAADVVKGGYESAYLEVQGAYRLHQDFAGASIPTSPSALTLWVGLNSSPDWNLRLFPGSHRHGLLCHRWLELDDPRLSTLGQPLDVPARAGSAVLFNALLLHGSANPGTHRRVSCDIRFFPFCGFLPSRTHALGPDPKDTLRQALENETDDVLRCPVLEDEVYLGHDVPLPESEPLSVLNWANYIARVVRGDADEAVPFLQRFTNGQIGADGPQTYVSAFHGKPLHTDAMQKVREQVG